MLKYPVKLTWVILCSIGTVFTWPVLWALAKVTGCWWIPLTFGSALTVLILSFDLGLIWDLKPDQFPIGFCLTQMTVVALTSSIMMGTCAAWYFSALSAAVWPSGHKRALRWRPSFIIVVIVIPVASTMLQMGFTLKYKAYIQTDYEGTLCDVTEPMWPKLFGYGASSLAYITPCLFFSIFSIRRLQRTMRAHQMIWSDMSNQVRFERPAIPLPSPCRPASDTESFQSSYNLVALQSPRLDVPNSPSSPTHLPSTRNSAMSSKYGMHELSLGENDISVVRLGDQSAPHSTVDIHVHTESPVKATSHLECDVSSYGSAPVPAFPNLPPRPSSSLLAGIWRLQLFLLAFVVICILLTLPTLVSVTQHRGPRQFGTDHIAGILVSWAVVGIFGHSPAIRKVLFGQHVLPQDTVIPFS
ncbi:hypothetical protein FIBSPDRAFT_1053173 [Athelia psychrophila]|uniref:STE3-domain-containing protein n=1 Tax=Athelia psychrophila TaxID=1759441 RepID=A0A167XDT3_9AGAM|nr:hypothetical protein FIBSPDRAFT_1053173 [Fibularhizoctonia sp. CBS 109695]